MEELFIVKLNDTIPTITPNTVNLMALGYNEQEQKEMVDAGQAALQQQ